jgi:hypothetical protein
MRDPPPAKGEVGFSPEGLVARGRMLWNRRLSVARRLAWRGQISSYLWSALSVFQNMNKREFFDLSFRVISIFLFLDMLSRTPDFLIYYVDSPMEVNAMRKLINVVFFFAIPLTIIWMSRTKSEWFLEKVLGDDARHPESDQVITAAPEDETPIPAPLTETIEDRGFTAENVQQIALIILGVWILSTSIPIFVRDLMIYIDPERTGLDELRGVVENPPVHWSKLIVSGVRTLIGLVLVMGVSTVSNTIDRWRSSSADM